MSSGDHMGQDGTGDSAYEPPKLEVLGSLAELTQLGSAPPDELELDGSQA